METHFSKISTGRNCSRNMVSSCKPLKKGLHFLLLASNFSNKLSEKKNYSHNNQRHTQKIMLKIMTTIHIQTIGFQFFTSISSFKIHFEGFDWEEETNKEGTKVKLKLYGDNWERQSRIIWGPLSFLPILTILKVRSEWIPLKNRQMFIFPFIQQCVNAQGEKSFRGCSRLIWK